LLHADLKAFREHPVLGVGPGVGKLYRQLPDGRGVSAHTEFTRLLAEHGMAGAVAIAILLVIVVGAYGRATTRRSRVWVLLLASWTLSEMSHGAMRFAAISFVFGLMTCTLLDDAEPRLEAVLA
jgi:O-antigen ligase